MHPHRYQCDERRPVEVLVFETDPAHVDEFLTIDHEIWTLGEAATPGTDRLPFLSKEVWLDDAHPGRITLIFVWESTQAWDHVGQPGLQAELQMRFDERFTHEYRLVRALHEESDHGIHRWSRFERVDPVD
jgi:uncharacterized protein (TIGR03792 family)